MIPSMNSITSTPGVLRLFAISILARAPSTMLSIGLLVHAQHLTGSFAAAGLVTGAYAVSVGGGGPVLGALVDRHGQTVVLLASAGASAALLGTTALMPVGAPVPALIALAAGIGLATPPLGACVRTLLPTLLRDPASAQAAYAFDASASELTWISGPPLVLVLIAVGVVFGAVEVAVAAAAKGLGSPASTGPLLGMWGLGSLIGGLVAARLGRMAQD